MSGCQCRRVSVATCSKRRVVSVFVKHCLSVVHIPFTAVSLAHTAHRCHSTDVAWRAVALMTVDRCVKCLLVPCVWCAHVHWVPVPVPLCHCPSACLPSDRCGGGGVDPIPCVSTHRISDPRSGPAQLLPPHVKQRSHPHGVRPQIPDR